MSDFIFRIKPNIMIGPYTISRIGQQVQGMGKRFMLIIDPILNEDKLADKIVQSLQEKEIDCFVFSELSEGSSSKTLDRALGLAREAHIHGVIAAGGEKAINIGRVVAAYYHEIKDIFYFLDGGLPTTEALPCVCVPSTFRTPFVFTTEAPITDARNHQIKLLHVQESICSLLLIDPNLMLSLTETQKSILAMELLSIGLEAYLSQKASFYSDMFVEKGLEILSYALDESLSLDITTPKEVLLSQAGNMVSMGCAISSLGISSSLALSIYSRYQINKSLTSAILLPFAIEDAANFKAQRIRKLAQIMRICSNEDTDESACNTLAEYVRQKIAQANLPSRLKDLKLSIDELSLAVEDINAINLINNLPRSMTTDDLFEFIKIAY